MDTDTSPSKRKKYTREKILRFEPSHCHQITSSHFILKYFENVNCVQFFQKIQEVGHNEQLIGLFSIALKKGKFFIVGLEFNFALESISIATGIPNHGEYWFKGMNVDDEYYKPYLKSTYKYDPLHVFPFRYLLDKYAPLMKSIMMLFTCEGHFSRLYQYHIRLLMNFTAVKSLNMCNYLFKSVSKMAEKIHEKGRDHEDSIFHHSLIKIIILHELQEKQITWE